MREDSTSRTVLTIGHIPDPVIGFLQSGLEVPGIDRSAEIADTRLAGESQLGSGSASAGSARDRRALGVVAGAVPKSAMSSGGHDRPHDMGEEAESTRPQPDQAPASEKRRRRIPCVDCRLIEPEPGTWVEGRCPRCAPPRRKRLRAKTRRSTPIRVSGPRPYRQDLTGQIFGKLTVIDRAANWLGRTAWNCRCECGSAVTVTANGLRSGGARSCGCLKASEANARLQEAKKDLEGRTFGRLTVVSLASGVSRPLAKWNCRCECGREVVVGTALLRNSPMPSCGCSKSEASRRNGESTRIDLVGRTFGRLTVLSYAYSRGKRPYWNCRCDCGSECIACGSHLRNGRTRSCGCLRRELGPGSGRKGAAIQRRKALLGTPRKLSPDFNRAKLTPKEVLAIRREYASEGHSFQQLADKYGISDTAVGQIIHHQTWREVGGPKTIRPRNKLTPIDVQRIRQQYADGGISHEALARKFGVSRPAISLVLSGKNWGHVSK